ncbi:c-type heme family protein [Desulfolithobacter sp.]
MKVRFQIGLACILVFFGAIVALITYFYEKSFFEEETFQKTQLVMAAVESTRTYVHTTLRPRMFEELGPDRFVLEAMSTSYISRVIMDIFHEKLPEFNYRRSALNARNPDFEATPKEREMITWFRDHPDEELWFGMIRDQGEEWFVQFRPVEFSAQCLHCHGDPADAPAAIRTRYGSDRGFYKTEGVIAGVQSISIPAGSQMAAIREAALQVFSFIVLVLLFLYAIIWIFFDRVVVRSLRSVLTLFRDSLGDSEGEKIYQMARKGDELRDLHTAAEMMANHLAESRRKLEQYACHLRSMVEQRTEALKRSQERLHHQVRDRNKELALLNTIAGLITQTRTLCDLLPALLQAALKVIPARGAGIYLFDRAQRQLELRCQEGDQDLALRLEVDAASLSGARVTDPDAIARLVAIEGCGNIRLTGDGENRELGIRVPLCCRERLLGMMVFSGIQLEDLDDALQALLISIGRQIGITLESLESISRLRHSKELLQTVFDAITDPMVLLDKDGIVRMVNRAFLEHCGQEESEIYGRTTEELSCDSPLPFSRCIHLLEAGRLPQSTEVTLDNGTVFTVTFYPVRFSGIAEESIVCFARDITRQQMVARQIKQAERLAAVGQLAAGVAHEINNPLGVILCYTDILKKEVGGGQAYRDLVVIERHTRTCQRIISDLLSFARSQKSSRELVNISSVLLDMQRILNRQMERKRISFSLDLAPELPLIMMDRERIRQVLFNLFINAIQAIGEDGEIHVAVRVISIPDTMDSRALEIRVRDSGCGISPDILPLIFDPFFTTKNMEEGTGLGLSVSYGIIEDHGGTITVESEPGQGAVFIITLPVIEEDAGDEINGPVQQGKKGM